MTVLLHVVIWATFLAAAMTVVVKIFRKYQDYRGKSVVACPEIQAPVEVQIDSTLAAITHVLGSPVFVLSDCSRWPERKSCGRECLDQIDAAPEECLVRHLIADWYDGKVCALCAKPFGRISWHDHKPKLLTPDGDIRSWDDLPATKLHKFLPNYLPLCWNCSIAETFRREHPGLVTDRIQDRHRHHSV